MHLIPFNNMSLPYLPPPPSYEPFTPNLRTYANQRSDGGIPILHICKHSSLFIFRVVSSTKTNCIQSDLVHPNSEKTESLLSDRKLLAMDFSQCISPL